ncbi:hypothetical protein O181_025046 [Austropuccinia psidii MF-1]|uniref:Uncharacterized protein n=1 Tax=Austropuccinia psidii MF-1 TaxID=1389203 RepID=A0A9Q3CMM5_9BASI|nr:hypothetical protein [Austropuccinia psidii MF-1]
MVQEWTQFHDSKSRSQNPTPSLKEDSSAHHYGNPWWLPEDHSRTQPPGPAGVGLAIHSGLFQGQFSEVITHFNQLSRHQVFQYSLDSSIGPYRWQSINLYVLGPIGPIHIPLWEFNHTVSISRWPELYWLNSDNTAGDSPSRISPSNFHIYWPPFSTWGLFPHHSEPSSFLSLPVSGYWWSYPLLIPLYFLAGDLQTRSQARPQAILTPTPRAPLDGTAAVPQLRAQLDRGPRMEGEAPSRKEGRGPRRSSSLSGVASRFPGLSRTNLKVPGEDDEEKEENSVEEEDSDGTEGVPAPVGESQGTGRPTLAQSNQPDSH